MYTVYCRPRLLNIYLFIYLSKYKYYFLFYNVLKVKINLMFHFKLLVDVLYKKVVNERGYGRFAIGIIHALVPNGNMDTPLIKVFAQRMNKRAKSLFTLL